LVLCHHDAWDVVWGSTTFRPIKIAIISNGSFIWRSETKETLKQADWVSLKVDSVDERIWRRINRPHADLDLKTILVGMLEFASEYEGVLTGETMLVPSGLGSCPGDGTGGAGNGA
jgi:wyosine [tRNA(Phe)-imidazoG37] synthetase (radical SAM superfamily)